MADCYGTGLLARRQERQQPHNWELGWHQSPMLPIGKVLPDIWYGLDAQCADMTGVLSTGQGLADFRYN